MKLTRYPRGMFSGNQDDHSMVLKVDEASAMNILCRGAMSWFIVAQHMVKSQKACNIEPVPLDQLFA